MGKQCHLAPMRLRINGPRVGLPITLCAIALPLTVLSAAPPDGEAVYRRRCAGCHEQTSPRIPTRQALQQMPSARILRALDSGAMMAVAFTMYRDERTAVIQRTSKGKFK